MKPLNEIVNDAYDVFSGNRPGEYLDACTHCCMKESDADLLKSTPLREISVELLTEYQDAAKPRELDKSELKYFTPRYLELVKDYSFPSYEPLLSLNRFGYLKKSDWTQKERELLNDFASSFFKKHINSRKHPTFTTPIEILLMFYKAKIDIQQLLSEWQNSNSVESLLHFNKLVEDLDFNIYGEPKVRDAFSDEIFNDIISNWLSAEQVKRKFREDIEREILDDNSSLSESEKESLNWKYELIK